MTQAVDFEVVTGSGNPHFLEKQITHIGVEVLPRVYDGFVNIVASADFPADYCRFHELRSCPYDGDNVHGTGIID